MSKKQLNFLLFLRGELRRGSPRVSWCFTKGSVDGVDRFCNRVISLFPYHARHRYRADAVAFLKDESYF